MQGDGSRRWPVSLCTFGGAASPALAADEVTLHVELSKASVKEGEEIRMKLVFTGGARDTVLILPMGADASGIFSYLATELTTGQEWVAMSRDQRSFAADDRRPLPAGGRIEWNHAVLWFEDPERPLRAGWQDLPAGKYRIVAIHDETKTFRPEKRGFRVIRSEPVEIVVTPR